MFKLTIAALAAAAVVAQPTMNIVQTCVAASQPAPSPPRRSALTFLAPRPPRPLPPARRAQADPELRALVDAVVAGGLAGTLSGPGPFTVL